MHLVQRILRCRKYRRMSEIIPKGEEGAGYSETETRGLLPGKNMPVLEWSKRVRIAIGSAKGLAYLHEDCHPKIIHRDIKSANILLENSFEPKVADFGLAKLSNDTYTHVSTRVMGTFGYMAPEYASSGKLTDRFDVFSFGVVLLELITGCKPVDTSRPLGDESLVEWARMLMKSLVIGGLEQSLELHWELLVHLSLGCSPLSSRLTSCTRDEVFTGNEGQLPAGIGEQRF